MLAKNGKRVEKRTSQERNGNTSARAKPRVREGCVLKTTVPSSTLENIESELRRFAARSRAGGRFRAGGGVDLLGFGLRFLSFAMDFLWVS